MVREHSLDVAGILDPPPTSQTQTPPTPHAVPSPTNPSHKSQGGRKHQRGNTRSSSSTVPSTDVKGSPVEEEAVPSGEVDVPAYIRAFMVDKEPLPTNERARP
ncbi:hypothetical protein SO802_002490 [Lithocarpus litseifolius]|uniref:Uncharacterized protein n=1 Tax=Lithocarpus litseifolius TaxID=425828 RepID=A0AAW2E2Q8_9ROSI